MHETEPGVLGHDYKTSTKEAEIGLLWVLGQIRLLKRNIQKNKTKQNNKQKNKKT